MNEIDLTEQDEQFGDIRVAAEVDAESLIERVIEIVKNAKSLPLSTSVRVEREELLELLEDAISRLPDEMRQAKFMLRERAEFLEKVHREGDEILDAARSRAEQMVQRTEIVREAQRVAQKAVDDAKETSRRLRLEAEDYCDQKLAAFEVVLDRTAGTVKAGREKLRVTPLPPADEEANSFFVDGDDDERGEGFYDQDRS